MSYTVNCWLNTGFNAVNIPDGPDRLGTPDIALPALDILQDWGLTSVRVRFAAAMNIQNIDYVQIGSEYYCADSPTLVASDVAEFHLTYDAITSAGGPKSLTYLDGLTERHSVSSDDMFAYTQDDEYMTPAEPLQLVTSSLYETTSDPLTVLESTINVYKLGNYSGLSTTDATPQGVTFYDTATATTDTENKVTVPVVTSIDSNTLYRVADSDNNIVGHDTRSAGTKLFVLDESNKRYEIIQNGLACVRSLGLESAIISQVQYDSGYVKYTTVQTDSSIDILTATGQSVSSALPFKYATVNNNRVLYGQYNKYGLMTASGDKGEYLPEQINDGNDSPNVKEMADPRPDGKPYFRYASYNGDTSSKGFFLSCLSGMQWKNVPLVYEGRSGSELTRLQFNNSTAIASLDRTAQQQQYQNDVSAMTRSAIAGIGKSAIQSGSGVLDLINGNGANGLASGAMSLIDTLNNLQTQSANLQLQGAYQGASYDLARQRELLNYAWSQSVVAPEIAFPYNAEIIRDFIGNGVLAYRYRYSDNDVTRIDKLLTMYGYKDIVPLTADLFTGRQYFNYVRARGVSIGGDLPIWKKSLIADQLSAGVRVWHTKPDPTYYTTGNPIS